MKVRILGKAWTLLFARSKDLPHDRLGECDPPHKRGRAVKVSEHLRGRKLADVVMHECLHAAAFDVLGEDFVTQVTTDISRVLWKPEVLSRLLDDDEVRKVLVPPERYQG